MAYSISSQQAFSRLIRCTFKQCAPRCTSRATPSSSRQARQLFVRSYLKPANPIGEHLEDDFIPIKENSNPTTRPSKPPQTVSSNRKPIAQNVTPPNKPSPNTRKASTSRGEEPHSPNKTNIASAAPTKRRVQRLKGKKALTAAQAKTQDIAEPPPREEWQIQKAALERKFPEQPWNPAKKLSPDALEGIRAMHAQYPEHFTTPMLADHFQVSPEAIRRILKSKWKPNPEEEDDRRKRWEKRGERIWTKLVEEKGLHPPKKWREKGIGRGIPRAPSGQLAMSRGRRAAVRSKTSSTREPSRVSRA